jgi:hypothetical protein
VLVVSESGYVQVGWTPSSSPGKIDAAVSCWIDPPEQPFPKEYRISP